MNEKLRLVARAAAFCALVALTGCGGGGGNDGGTAPPPAPPVNRAPSLTTSTLATDEDTATTAQLTASDLDGNPVIFALADAAAWRRHCLDRRRAHLRPGVKLLGQPALERTTQCTMTGDDGTVIDRQYAADSSTQLAYAVDAANPRTPRFLASPAEVAS